MTRGRRIGPLPGSALLEGANACEWSDGECPRPPVAAVATTHRHRGRRGGLCGHDSTGDDACPARPGAAGRGGPRAHGRDGDGDGGGRDPRRGDEPGLRRSTLVVGGRGVRPLRGGGAARQRARGGRRHASPAADPRGRVRRGAADARACRSARRTACPRLWRGCSRSSVPCSRPRHHWSPSPPSRPGSWWRCSWWRCCRRGPRWRSVTSWTGTGAAAGRGCGSGSVSRSWRSPSCTGR